MWNKLPDMRQSLAVGIAQWLALAGQPEANLAAALSLIAEARAMGAELMVLPELWLSGYDPATLATDAVKSAVEAGDPVVTRLSAAAREHRMWLVAGSLPEAEGGRLFNTCFVFGPSGKLVTRHRKAHLYPPRGEESIFTAGDSLTTFSDPSLGSVGVVICFDGDFPEVAAAVSRGGARLVVAPCACEVESAQWWDLVYPATALVNGQWWVQANQCGRMSSGTYLGGSRVVAPSGTVIAEAARALPGVTPPAEVLVRRIDLRIGDQCDPRSELLRTRRRPDLYA